MAELLQLIATDIPQVASVAAGDRTVIVRSGALKTAPYQDVLGITQVKTLIVALIGGQYIKSVDPVNDRGWVSKSYGTDNNIMQIENYAKSGYSWDYSKGDPVFFFERCSAATIDVNPPSSGNNDLGTVASQSAMLALTALINDACLRSDVGAAPGTYYVRTAGTANPSILSDWTALPAGAESGVVQVLNPIGIENVINGPVRGYKSRGINVWIKQ